MRLSKGFRSFRKQGTQLKTFLRESRYGSPPQGLNVESPYLQKQAVGLRLMVYSWYKVWLLEVHDGDETSLMIP